MFCVLWQFPEKYIVHYVLGIVVFYIVSAISQFQIRQIGNKFNSYVS